MRSTALAAAAMFLVQACKGDEPDADPGALIDVDMSSTVGVLLDEIPAAHRDRAADAYLAEPTSFWEERAHMQIETTLYRLVYRNFFYDNAGQLPLPPKEIWEVTVSAPRRATIDGHDLVVVDYTLHSTLLTPYKQPAIAEPKLAKAGGVWVEPFVLPADPDLLLERTGYACMDEADFPPNSVDTENARAFYDDLCEGDTGCHITEPVAIDCRTAVADAIGAVETNVRFERLPWDAKLADAVRVGEQAPGIAQLKALPEGVEDNRVIYRYFPADSCAIAEGCVGGSGWRRLLQFTATQQNMGELDLYLGDVGPSSAAVANKLVSPSACHGHMHFNHYGNFEFGTGANELGSKRAFCLESTSRPFNNESAVLVHPYGCHYQGTAAGWADDYIAGLDCQWVDITPITGPISAPLTFHVNPDAFLCEGEPILNGNGNLTFELTDFLNEDGERESAIACEEAGNWDADNIATATVNLPADGGLVTGECKRGQLGEKRACGFTELDDTLTCTAGAPVSLSCTVADVTKPQVLRICEASHALDTGTACTWRDALASATVDGPVSVDFTCPALRDVLSEPGGRYAIYGGAMLPNDAEQPIVCVPVP